MSKILDRTGLGAAISADQNDSNLDSLSGINESQTGTSYTVTIDDQNRTIEFSNASPVAVTLTLISTIVAALHTSDFKVTLKNIGAGTVTVTPTTDTFDDGDASKTLEQYEHMTIQTDSAQTAWNIIESSNASKVDGLDASQFLRSDASDTTSGDITVDKTTPRIILDDAGTGSASYRVVDNGTLRSAVTWDRTSDELWLIQYDTDGSTIRSQISLTELGKVDITTGTLQIAGTDMTSSAADLSILASTTLTSAQLNSIVGKQTIFVPAGGMHPTYSNGCASLTTVETTAGRPDMQVLDFDATSDEHAQFQVAFPKQWNEGTVTFQAFWTTTNTGTTGVAWGLQGVAVSDNDTIDVAYGTAVVVTDNNQSAAEDMLVTSESSAITIAGTPAAGDMCFFRIFRDVSDAADTMTEDARLIGIKLHFTNDTVNDA